MVSFKRVVFGLLACAAYVAGSAVRLRLSVDRSMWALGLVGIGWAWLQQR